LGPLGSGSPFGQGRLAQASDQNMVTNDLPNNFQLSETILQLGLIGTGVGLVIVDHGSRRQESNDGLLDVARRFAAREGLANVQPAHMELAEPSVETAFRRCVDGGAKFVVVMPFFLLPGRHWDQDIPQLAAAAAGQFPGVKYLVTAPLGTSELILYVMASQIDHCLRHALEDQPDCDLCRGTTKCQTLGG